MEQMLDQLPVVLKALNMGFLQTRSEERRVGKEC